MTSPTSDLRLKWACPLESDSMKYTPLQRQIQILLRRRNGRARIYQRDVMNDTLTPFVFMEVHRHEGGMVLIWDGISYSITTLN